MSRIANIARDFAGRGGKRLRPRLCQAVFDACGGTGDLSPVCEAVESFHKASLVHDDIQDGDETRYGRPTVWKEHGVPMAIAAGDWLVAHGYQLIAGSGFAAVPAMLAATIDSHVRLCEGQGDDLLGGGDYVSTCERKTGEAFALAAQLGRWPLARTTHRSAAMPSPMASCSRSTTIWQTARIRKSFAN